MEGEREIAGRTRAESTASNVPEFEHDSDYIVLSPPEFETPIKKPDERTAELGFRQTLFTSPMRPAQQPEMITSSEIEQLSKEFPKEQTNVTQKDVTPKDFPQNDTVARLKEELNLARQQISQLQKSSNSPNQATLLAERNLLANVLQQTNQEMEGLYQILNHVRNSSSQEIFKDQRKTFRQMFRLLDDMLESSQTLADDQSRSFETLRSYQQQVSVIPSLKHAITSLETEAMQLRHDAQKWNREYVNLLDQFDQVRRENADTMQKLNQLGREIDIVREGRDEAVWEGNRKKREVAQLSDNIEQLKLELSRVKRENEDRDEKFRRLTSGFFEQSEQEAAKEVTVEPATNDRGI
jgi:chromosome segregation ATPase